MGKLYITSKATLSSSNNARNDILLEFEHMEKSDTVGFTVEELIDDAYAKSDYQDIPIDFEALVEFAKWVLSRDKGA